MNPAPAVRPAVEGDARAIAEVHVAGWRGGYRGLVDDAVLDALSVEDRAAGWARGLAGGSRVLLAGTGGRVEGFACFGAARDEDLPAGTGEVHALYVLPAAWGRGTGGALLDAAVAELLTGGAPGVVLWALEGNARARRFYERRGWRTDGVRRVERFDGQELPAVRHRWAGPATT
ncbi:GNAT family N-acetyltransferase [Kineococcus glutinatus]|uniref:GNAT family N-acetyltransferase n=1 Tax=Kineococcus glutinatus TaxID=1070872 RepID=A0ABP9HXA9_9ACTN